VRVTATGDGSGNGSGGDGGGGGGDGSGRQRGRRGREDADDEDDAHADASDTGGAGGAGGGGGGSRMAHAMTRAAHATQGGARDAGEAAATRRRPGPRTITWKVGLMGRGMRARRPWTTVVPIVEKRAGNVSLSYER
jgi:hypothetical protein